MKKAEHILKELPWGSYAKLFAQAEVFRRMAPWLWVEDVDIVCLKDATGGVDCYACLLGKQGSFEGMALYEGPQGLEILSGLLKKEITVKDRDSFFRQNGLIMNFAKRESLDALNLGIQERLEKELELMPQKTVPQFLSVRPWHVPWYLNEREAKLMLRGMDLMMEFSRMAQMSPEWLDVERVSKNGFHVFAPMAEGNLGWESFWVNFPLHTFSSGDILPPPLVDRLLALPLDPDHVWQAHLFCVPSPLDDGESMYYPRCTLVVDAESGQMYHSGMDDAKEDWRGVLLRRILKAIEAVGYRPAHLEIQERTLCSALQAVLPVLNIKVEFKPGLEMLSIVRADFEREFSESHPNATR